MIKNATANNYIELSVRLRRNISHIVPAKIQIVQAKDFFAEKGFLYIRLPDFYPNGSSTMECEFNSKGSFQTAQVKHPAIRKRFAGQIICNLNNAFKSGMGRLKAPPGPNTMREWNIIGPIAILKRKFIEALLD